MLYDNMGPLTVISEMGNYGFLCEPINLKV